ncbi:Cryptic plasmid protein A [Paraburkholderia ribeironis]|uniref:Cryptic plasmid protein A n=1 Tax=Paraburkholderia ribeironis TaxID=1247936 RepID=A0A1N7SLA7_9BURK|nr:hypothetical protein [Paraburkholderia ribeironis]SIT48187.1 Cryptic plasmid protein A [Paraburkholderia ribeironis]
MEEPTPSIADVIIESDRDLRGYAYLIQTCGETRVANARQKLAGRTRPYVSNLAKVLGVTIPEIVVITPREEARQRLSEIKKIIRRE